MKARGTLPVPESRTGNGLGKLSREVAATPPNDIVRDYAKLHQSLVHSATGNDAQLPAAQDAGNRSLHEEMNEPSGRSAQQPSHSTSLEHVLDSRPMTLVAGRWMQRGGPVTAAVLSQAIVDLEARLTLPPKWAAGRARWLWRARNVGSIRGLTDVLLELEAATKVTRAEWKARVQGLHTYPTFATALADFELALREAGFLPSSGKLEGEAALSGANQPATASAGPVGGSNLLVGVRNPLPAVQTFNAAEVVGFATAAEVEQGDGAGSKRRREDGAAAVGLQDLGRTSSKRPVRGEALVTLATLASDVVTGQHAAAVSAAEACDMPSLQRLLAATRTEAEAAEAAVQESTATRVPSLPSVTPHSSRPPQTCPAATAADLAAVALMASAARQEGVTAQKACASLEGAVAALTEEGRGRYEALAKLVIELMPSRIADYGNKEAVAALQQEVVVLRHTVVDLAQQLQRQQRQQLQQQQQRQQQEQQQLLYQSVPNMKLQALAQAQAQAYAHAHAQAQVIAQLQPQLQLQPQAQYGVKATNEVILSPRGRAQVSPATGVTTEAVRTAGSVKPPHYGRCQPGQEPQDSSWVPGRQDVQPGWSHLQHRLQVDHDQSGSATSKLPIPVRQANQLALPLVAQQRQQQQQQQQVQMQLQPQPQPQPHTPPSTKSSMLDARR